MIDVARMFERECVSSCLPNPIIKTLESSNCSVVLIPSPERALQLLDSELNADLLLIDVSSSRLTDAAVLRCVLDRPTRARWGLLLNAGDHFWSDFARKWHMFTITKVPNPDLESETPASGCAFIPKATLEFPGGAVGETGYHLEELDNNRFFLAASPAMKQIYRDIRVIAPVNLPVLILGESGVGKENVARLLHKYHHRSDKNLVNVNCAALPNELLESELFGYEAGAFTGATKSKPGMFELAQKGTLLLDEIGEMSPQMQAKLLHVLQDGSFCRLGARSASQVDVRVLAATNVNIEEAIAAKRFREDLYYRLNALTITIPPLRERREEIPVLMRELFRRGAVELGQKEIDADRIVEAAQDYDWPGNLRELKNFTTRTLILRDERNAYEYLRNKTRADLAKGCSEEIAVEQQPIRSASLPGMRGAVSTAKKDLEIRMLQNALSASGWNRRRAAKDLNISYRTLLYKIQEHGLKAGADACTAATSA